MPKLPKKDERNAAIVLMRKEGKSLIAISEAFSISSARVSQIIKESAPRAFHQAATS